MSRFLNFLRKSPSVQKLASLTPTQLVLIGFGVYGLGQAGTYFLLKDPNATPLVAPPETHRLDNFARRSQTYDAHIDREEWWNRVGWRREDLLKYAHGDVLEVAAGTCRNLDYYSNHCRKVVLTDSVPEMLTMGLRKLRKSQVGGTEVPDSADQKGLDDRKAGQQNTATEFEFRVMAGEDLDFPDDSFDTVVDTFGICSFEDPIQALLEMRRVCKPNGRILLLEHGLSYKWAAISAYLKSNTLRHAHSWGCYFHRDIMGIVEQAQLKVLRYEDYTLGTFHLMVCSPNKSVSEIATSELRSDRV